MDSIISLHDLSFTYAAGTTPALRALTLEIPPQQICAIVGRAGAGKTTLCTVCAGFIPQFFRGQISGTATVDGLDAIALSVAELVRTVGMVGSNPFSQISGARFTVYDEIAFGLENLGYPREEIIARADWALGIMRLTELRDRSPYALSGGQQQRLVLAATLALRPRVLILDEPTAQLDPPTTLELAGILRELAQQGTTIVVAEHRLEWVAELADRVVVLDQGAIIADGTPQEVFTNPLLLEREIGWPRPALLAAQARDQRHWPTDQPLPVTTEALLAGLAAATTSAATPPASPIHDEAAAATTQHDAPIVAISDIHYRYPSGVAALRGVSMAIGHGERITLLGRNGAGKSTLVRHLNGLLQPASGAVTVADVNTNATTVAKNAKHVGIVFQDIRNQLFARTVRDELRFGPRNLGYAPDRVEQLVDAALDALDLRQFAADHPYDLPPAFRRLVAIGAVLAMDTDLLVLDEPTAGLDTRAVERLKTLTQHLANAGKSVLVVSHDLDFCYEALERVVLMQDGQIIIDGAWNALSDTEYTLMNNTIGMPLALRAAEVLRQR